MIHPKLQTKEMIRNLLPKKKEIAKEKSDLSKEKYNLKIDDISDEDDF